MRVPLCLLLNLVLMTPGFMQAARADDAGTAYIVSYFEVMPPSKDRVLALLRQFGKASRGEGGNLRFEVLQRIGQPDQFVILEAWKDKEAQAAHGAAGHTKEFRESLLPFLRGPYDERPHSGLAVGAQAQPAGAARNAAVYGVTHVDIVPTQKDVGIGLVKGLSEGSRKDGGNLRFDALQQNSRLNHMTVVEHWKDAASADAHGMASHKKLFREQLMPLSGSLYDERLYKSVE